jgi:spore maturation protein CgeB
MDQQVNTSASDVASDRGLHVVPRREGPRVLILAPYTEWIFQNLTPSFRRVCSMVYAMPLGNSMSNAEVPNWHSIRGRIWDRALSDIRSLVRDQKIDLIFSMLYDDAITSQQALTLRSMGVPLVHYHVDMNEQWYRVLGHVSTYDLMAVSHMQHLEPIMRRGVPLHYMPMAASPDRYLVEAPSATPESNVLFLGSPNNARFEAIASAVQSGERVDIFGRGWDKFIDRHQRGEAHLFGSTVVHPSNRWPRRLENLQYILPCALADGSWFFKRFRRSGESNYPGLVAQARRAVFHGAATDAEVPSLLQRAKIVLGVNQRSGRVGDRFGVTDSRLRDFEVPMTGGFYLVQNFLDLPSFYRLGYEVESWSTLGELIEKIRHFIANPDARRRIAQAGQRRALCEHTWDVRLDGLLRVMGFQPRTTEPERLLEATLSPLCVVNNYGSQPWDATWPGCSPTDKDMAGDKPQIPQMQRS